MAEDEIVRKHHQLNGHDFERIPGDSGGQKIFVCFIPWGCKELDMTEQKQLSLSLSPCVYIYIYILGLTYGIFFKSNQICSMI